MALRMPELIKGPFGGRELPVKEITYFYVMNVSLTEK